MDFEWDEDKSEACFQERGFDFAYAAHVFFDPDRTVLPDERIIYGEARYQVYGTILDGRSWWCVRNGAGGLGLSQRERQTRGRSDVMCVYKTEGGLSAGRIDTARVDATTEADIKRHIEADDQSALSEAGAYARRIRKQLGLTQVQLAAKLDVSLDTLRNWEQGKRYPTGPAKALLKILDRSPEAALAALNDAP